MDNSVIFTGSLYLVQIKENANYGARDLLWAIGQNMGEPLDYQGMKGLIKASNGRGLITPKLSSTSITWGEIKAQVELQRLSIVGDPMTILENVHSFYRIVNLAYDAKILTSVPGWNLLQGLTMQKPRIKVEKDSRNEKIEEMKGRARIKMEYEQNVLWEENENGEFVRVGGSGADGEGGASGRLVRMQEAPLVEDVDISDTIMEENVNLPGIGATEEVVSNTRNEVFSGGLDEIDRMMEGLEDEVTDESIRGWKDKAGVFQKLAKNLRAKVKNLEDENLKLVKASDLDKKRLHEYQSHSVTELIQGISPRLEPLDDLKIGMLGLKEDMVAMEERLARKFQLRTEDVLESVEESKIARNSEHTNVLRHLDSRGLVDKGSSYDIPEALGMILERMGRNKEEGFTGSGREKDLGASKVVQKPSGVVEEPRLKMAVKTKEEGGE